LQYRPGTASVFAVNYGHPVEQGRSLYFCPVIFVFFFLSFFFPHLISAMEIGCLPYFHTWCGLSANWECVSEMCCTWLNENTGRKKLPFWHHRTKLLGCIFAAKAYVDDRKNVLNIHTFSTCPHNMVNFGLVTAEIRWRVWGTPANFNGFRILAALLHGTV